MKLRSRLLLWVAAFLVFAIPHNVRADNPIPTLPTLTADTDTSFYAIRTGIAHGTVARVSYTSYRGIAKEMKIYLPPNYDAGGAEYPVLYLSHGMGGNENHWTNIGMGMAQYILDNLIADGNAVPMIIVMPRWDGQYFGLDLANGPPPLGDDDVVTQELVKDIIPYVESHYRARPGRLSRAIAGLSLGGYASLNTGLRRLDVFSEIFLYSPFDNPVSLANLERNYQSVLTDPNTNELLAVPLYIGMGTSDSLLPQALSIDELLRRYGINRYLQLSTGAHEFMNWRRYLHQTAQIMFPAWTQEAPGSIITLNVPDSGAASTATKGGTETAAGYAAASIPSGNTPYGVAVFGLKQSGVTVTEAGIPVSPPTRSARIFIDYRSGVSAIPARADSGMIDTNTGLAVVNMGSATANVTYTLRDMSGHSIATGRGTIGAGTYFACFIDQLKDKAAPDFNLPPDFRTATRFGSLEIGSDQPLSVLALRGTSNQRSDFLITTTPIADLTQAAGNGQIYFPQFADGGGYTTSLILLNTSNAVATGSFQIRDRDGNPLVVNPVGGDADSSFRYSIEPDGVFRFQTDGSPADPKTGWVRVIPDDGTSTPAGSGVFGLNPGDILVSESGIPATASTTHARVYVDLSNGHNTGLAIANIGSTEAKIGIKAFKLDGATGIGAAQDLPPLAADGYTAAFADQFVKELPEGFTGVMDISSPAPFAALTLRSLINERGDFLMTTFPVADVNAPAPSPIVFPQVVDGGGYVTQFILLSAVGPSSMTLNFKGDDGKPLPIGE